MQFHLKHNLLHIFQVKIQTKLLLNKRKKKKKAKIIIFLIFFLFK